MSVATRTSGATSTPTSISAPASQQPTNVAATSTPVAPAEQSVRDFITKNYPAYSFLLDVPDIVNVFKNALDPASGNTTLTESTNQLLAQIQATPWWRTHGEAVRQYMTLQQTDPATLNQKIQAQDAVVHQIANRMGLGDNQVNIDQFARNSIMYGWSSQELQEQLASQLKYSPGQTTPSSNLGTIDSAMSTLKSTAASYMVQLDDKTAFGYAKEIAAGHHTIDDYTPMFQDQAKGRFPTLADSIDKGITPQQYFAPIQAEVGKLLEVPPDAVDLMNNPQFSKIISYTDPKTNAPRPMTISEAQTYTRGLDQWKSTRQGQQAAADMGLSILQTFGKV